MVRVFAFNVRNEYKNRHLQGMWLGCATSVLRIYANIEMRVKVGIVGTLVAKD